MKLSTHHRTVVSLILLLAGMRAGFAGGGSPSTYEQSLEFVSFESVDLAPLTSELRQRQGSLSESQLQDLVERNLRHIFYNRINRIHFLVAPTPEKVITQIKLILSLNERLRNTLRRGRFLLAEGASVTDQYAVLDKVKVLAKELKSKFSEFFVEGHTSRYSLLFSDSRDLSVQFAHFLIQSNSISVELNKRFEQYFFGASPGAVSLNQYEEDSIGTLIESLEMLSNTHARRISSASHALVR